MNNDQTVEYYQQRAREYDQVYFRDNPGRQEELKGLYTMSERAFAQKNVIDLACGTGFWTRIIASAANSVVGMDINPGTLAEAKKKTYACPARFVLGDIFNLPFSAEEFDGLMASFLFSHIRRQDLNRVREILMPIMADGSVAFFCDNNIVCEKQPDLIWDNEHINSYKKRKLENGDEYQILKNYYDRRELMSVFEPWGRIKRFVFREYYWVILLTIDK